MGIQLNILSGIFENFNIISFEYPYLLYLTIPVILFFFLKIQKKKQKKLSLNYSFSRPVPKSPILNFIFLISPILQLITVLSLILALSRPFKTIYHEKIEREGIDIMIGLDISVSMNENDFSPTRLEVAKNLAKEFILKRKNDKIGLIAFAGEPYLVSALTMDTSYLFESIRNLKIGLIKEEGTAIGDAMGMCLNQLRKEGDKQKIGILISDGNNTVGNLDPSISSDLSNYFNTKFYTIAVGSYEAKFDQVDESTLSLIAQTTQGKFFRAKDENSLESIFNEIDQLEKRQTEIVQWEEKINLGDNFIILSFVCFIIFITLKISPFGTILID